MSAPTITLCLLGGFRLVVGDEERLLPSAGQRLLAFCALQPGSRDRGIVSGNLWPDVGQSDASKRLRSALWKVGAVEPRAMEADRSCVRLAPDVGLDLAIDGPYQAGRNSSNAADEAPVSPPADDIDSVAVGSSAGSRMRVDLLRNDVLPSWDDDWLTVPRERWRQQRLHALEHLAWTLGLAGRYEEGVDAALCAIGAEPLRESAHRVLVRLHLAEGNRSEAVRQVECFTVLCRGELGVDPSQAFSQLVARQPPP